jgi:hypothetical protein
MTSTVNKEASEANGMVDLVARVLLGCALDPVIFLGDESMAAAASGLGHWSQPWTVHSQPLGPLGEVSAAKGSIGLYSDRLGEGDGGLSSTLWCVETGDGRGGCVVDRDSPTSPPERWVLTDLCPSKLRPWWRRYSWRSMPGRGHHLLHQQR